MNDTPVCRCETFVHPQRIENAPGRDMINYRLGDFLQFRDALLRPRPDEVQLLNWRPTATGDLAVQMLEWWAYLADILTFYNERIANESNLRTAELPESVKRLIRILGYRPRPGIGATGVVAALLSGPGLITIPRAFPIQSKPGPGKDPQTFEVDADTLAVPPDAVPVDPIPDLHIGSSVLLKGTLTSIHTGDELLLLKRGWAGESTGQALVTVQSAVPEKDARGRADTRVTFTAASGLPSSARVTDYRLLRSTLTTALWPYATTPANNVISQNSANATAIVREMARGTPLLFDLLGTVKQLVQVNSYAEVVWFAIPKAGQSDPAIPPDSPAIGISIPHSVIGFGPALSTGDLSALQANIPGAVLRFGWRDVGELVASPVTGIDGSSLGVSPAAGAAFPSNLNARPILLEDGNGNGCAATATSDGALLTLSGITGATTLKLPLQVLFSLLSVSRGKTVANEILGSGDASVAAQEFALQKKPLTYLRTTDPAYLDGYKSALRVWVDGVEWTEVPSFYGETPSARIFVTREDEDNQTHVQFGDGTNGARLATGVSVVAQYRYGSGADAPDPGKLTLITQPVPGLKSIHNPVAPGGGADADSRDRIRQFAPKSVLAFGRAVSGDDYEIVAAQTPGVARARAYWAFDAVRQRTVVALYVGDNASAVAAAKMALVRSSDPNRPVVVKLAIPVRIAIQFVLVLDPAYQAPVVADGVRAALTDPDLGLLGANTVRIGRSVFRSQIEDTCLRVPGALAVHSLDFFVLDPVGPRFLDPSFRHFPGEGAFYALQPSDVSITTEIASYAV
jgi:hypothetical protein